MPQISLPLITDASPQLEGAEVQYLPVFCKRDEADALLRVLVQLQGWRQDQITIFGKTNPIPRLHRWFADGGQAYRWSGITMQAEPFPDALAEVRRRLRNHTESALNTALANLYRTGRDSVSWHADDEPELGENPPIASLSLGATRRFVMRRKDDRSVRREFLLEHGSLLLMTGTTQRYWEHSVPKTSKQVGKRVNITFRRIGEQRK